MRKRYIVILCVGLGLIVAWALTGCAAPAPTPTTAPPATAVPKPTAIPPSPVPPTVTAKPPTATSVPTPSMAEVYPQTPPSLSAGAKIYAANCLPCHGEKGDGKGSVGATLNPPPANFTDKDFARGDPPEDWFQSITNGRPDTAMPAWKDKLSEQDRWNVLFYERNFVTTPDSIAAGKDLYAKNCAACHGDKGDGKGPAGAALKPPPADFTDPKMMAAHSSEELYTTLTLGEEDMPAFQKSLSDDQRWSLVDYLWTFIYQP